ncbi:aldo/keto reductase [Clostridia bacterium]|nr:aldo/keto reductase [Clostridia bacterium]
MRLKVNKDGLGALPLQRDSVEDAVKLIRGCIDAGIDFIDTARAYSDSEEKLGLALDGYVPREKLTIATKTGAGNAEDFWAHLETSLRLLKTDYADVYQFHNPAYVPRPGDENGLYDAALKAKAQGKIRRIGFTNHRLAVATEAVKSGLYETLQFPFSYLASDSEIELVRLCKERDVDFIAMKALSGGLITDIGAARAWLNQYDNVIPIWGLQHYRELELLTEAAKSPVQGLTPERSAKIALDRTELLGEFCRGCGYCMPCPEEIQIHMCARTSLLLRRSPTTYLLSPDWYKEMAKIDKCRECGLCASRCPYGLDTPALLKKNWEDYKEQYPKV